MLNCSRTKSCKEEHQYMQQIQLNGLNLWQFENLREEPSIRHFVTDRASLTRETTNIVQVSESEVLLKEPSAQEERGKEFTLSFSSSPDKEEIRSNRNLLAAALGVPGERLFFPSQVHENRIVRVNPSTTVDELRETDALITNEKGLCIAVLAADCVPILLYDRENKAVGAIHSGWRGTVARILQKTLQEMHHEFGTKGEDLIACIGPSVCQESYEVGEEVVHKFTHEYGPESGLLIPQPKNKAKLDLWQANKLQLLEFGVDAARIEVSGLCTVKKNEHFFSARKGDSGRFAAGIMLV